MLPPSSGRLQQSVLIYKKTARIGASIDPIGVGRIEITSVDPEGPFCKTRQMREIIALGGIGRS
jgi:hypothetical protein